MSIPFYIAEAFNTGPSQAYSGNPAGVIFLEYDDDVPDETKLKIASTINMFTTAFVSEKGWKRPQVDEKNGSENIDNDPRILNRTIRWYTPTTETVYCGHATLATCKVLSTISKQVEQIRFESKYRGSLVGDIKRGVAEFDDSIFLDFPESPPTEIPSDTPWIKDLNEIFLGQESFEYVGFSNKTRFLLLVLKRKENEDAYETIRKIKPNFQKLLEVDFDGLPCEGFSVTIQGDTKVGGEQPNCYSRQFSPLLGLNEDHVCGSMHTMVISYWVNLLNLHGQYLKAHQASERGGELRCLVTGGRVKLCGRGRVVSEGKLNV